jgi:hypothetical protein
VGAPAAKADAAAGLLATGPEQLQRQKDVAAQRRRRSRVLLVRPQALLLQLRAEVVQQVLQTSIWSVDSFWAGRSLRHNLPQVTQRSVTQHSSPCLQGQQAEQLATAGCLSHVAGVRKQEDIDQLSEPLLPRMPQASALAGSRQA